MTSFDQKLFKWLNSNDFFFSMSSLRNGDDLTQNTNQQGAAPTISRQKIHIIGIWE